MVGQILFQADLLNRPRLSVRVSHARRDNGLSQSNDHNNHHVFQNIYKHFPMNDFRYAVPGFRAIRCR